MNCFVFDIDGVITDIKEKRVREPKIIEIISSRLEKDTPVILITGRSLDWVEKIVLPSILNEVSNLKNLDNLLIIGEFGGDSIKFKQGQKQTHVNYVITLPEDLKREAKVATDKYSDTMFTDHTKKTQFTSEVKENVDLENDYRPKQKELAKEYQKLVDKYNLVDQFEVHRDRLGTNIRSKKTNKSHAVKIALDWLKGKRLKIDKFIVFGDSKSDLEMAVELRRQNKNFDFIYVGEKEEIEDQDLSGIKFTKEKFEKGTLEYLSSIGLH